MKPERESTSDMFRLVGGCGANAAKQLWVFILAGDQILDRELIPAIHLLCNKHWATGYRQSSASFSQAAYYRLCRACPFFVEPDYDEDEADQGE